MCMLFAPNSTRHVTRQFVHVASQCPKQSWELNYYRSYAFDYFHRQQEKDAESKPSEDAKGASDSNPRFSNTAIQALQNGIPSHLTEFQITTDEAVKNFNAFQSTSWKGMQAGGLIGKQPATTVHTAYWPVWAFSLTASAEYCGQMGVKDPTRPDAMVWKDMEDWKTLFRKREYRFQDHPDLQVYASYNFERSLGEAAKLPSPQSILAGRPLSQQEAEQLRAAAGKASVPSRLLRPEQQGDATKQQPLNKVTDAAAMPSTTFDAHGASSSAAPRSHPQQAQTAAASTQQGTRNNGQSHTAQDRNSSNSPIGGHANGADGVAGVVIHPPDMSQDVAWQLAYRQMMQQLVQEASEAAVKDSSATDARDVHVNLQIESMDVRLLYMPVYVAHYQHGQRYKQGTSTVVMPQMFYATISGLENGRIIAATHLCPKKTQTLTATLVGGVGLAAGTGVAEALPVGPVEAVTLAVITAAVAGMWAQGLPQAARNDMMAKQVSAEREFYRQYDARETRTAAALSATLAAAEAAGRPPPTIEEGQQADEYMQWLWMDYDWRRWQCDEPWNWDAVKKQKEADIIAARTVGRRRQRQQYLEQRLEERRRREFEAEQEAFRQRHGRPGRSYAGTRFASEGVTPGAQYVGKRRDFLGYYKLLGLAEDEDITPEVIKTAFKAQALQFHPDKVMSQGANAETQKKAHVKFQKLQIAYDVLRDPEKRRAYDRGQLVQ